MICPNMTSIEFNKSIEDYKKFQINTMKCNTDACKNKVLVVSIKDPRVDFSGTSTKNYPAKNSILNLFSEEQILAKIPLNYA